MTYTEAIAFIHSVEWQGSRPGLSRITELLSRLGNPEKDLKIIHVAGTNGKGSFCAMLAEILRHSGYRTGLFTSPYIEQFEERIQINGTLISEEELAEIVTEIAPLCREMKDPPTEFEILTAIGYTYFHKKEVDLAVVECGMGGRLDSTNVIDNPLLSVITGISLDHTAFLGDTVEAIAAEKAGIIKPSRPVLYGGRDESARRVIAARADKLGAAFAVKDYEAIQSTKVTLDGTTFDYKEYKNISLSLLGSYQPENAASVLEAVTLLRREGLTLPDDAVRKGLSATRWKGRFEKLSDDPVVIFDGGHNEEGVAAAVATVKACFPDKKLHVISGVMKDKDYYAIADGIASIASKVYTVAPDNPRALPADEYAAVFAQKGVKATPYQDYPTAVKEAYGSALKEKAPLLCVGSLYAYRAFKEELQKLTAARESKRRAKRLLITIAVLFVLLLGLNLLLDSGIISRWLNPPPESIDRSPVVLYPADYEENIFEDTEYMSLDRTLYYYENGQGSYLTSADDAAKTGAFAAFFYTYFDTVIHGNHVTYNTFFTQNYREENGSKGRFTMQKLYDMEVKRLSQEPQGDTIIVHEFEVSYRILFNNGTYRDNLASETARPVIYRIYEYVASGELRIESISEYNIAK